MKGKKINHLLQVKFEEMIADPLAFIGNLSTFLDIPEHDFEASVFKKHLNWDKPVDLGDRIQEDSPAYQFDEKDRALLGEEHLVQMAAQYSYRIGV